MEQKDRSRVLVTVMSTVVLLWLGCSGLVENSGNDEGGGNVSVSAGGSGGLGGSTKGGVGLGGFTSVTPPASIYCTTTDGLDGEMVDTFPCPDYIHQCEAYDQPGEYDQDKYDSTCPDEPTVSCSSPGEVRFLSHFAGCCRSDGYCGLWDSYGDYFDSWFGCFSRDPWIENASLFGEEKVPIRCTPK
jgi:hypothetical protein